MAALARVAGVLLGFALCLPGEGAMLLLADGLCEHVGGWPGHDARGA